MDPNFFDARAFERKSIEAMPFKMASDGVEKKDSRASGRRLRAILGRMASWRSLFIAGLVVSGAVVFALVIPFIFLNHQ